MNTMLYATYKRFRQMWSARFAFGGARTLLAFRAMEDQGKVRLRALPEEESYFDVYGLPEAYTDQHGRYHTEEEALKETADWLNKHGAWWVVAEYLPVEGDDPEWEHADSVGFCVYADPLCPFENSCITDLMQSALDARRRSEIEADSEEARLFAFGLQGILTS